MLVSATEMLKKAKAGHYAVGQFNINNLEWTKSILLTAQELKSPVILGVSEGAGKYMTGFKTVAAMVKAMDEELGITVPVALHLDHGTYEDRFRDTLRVPIPFYLRHNILIFWLRKRSSLRILCLYHREELMA